MSKRFLTPVGLFSAATDPNSASVGNIYFNTASNVARLYFNSQWNSIHNVTDSYAGSLITGYVASATVATTAGHASTASSINASLLTGTTLASNVVNSSLTSVGTLTNLTVTNTISGRAASANVATHAGTASSIAGSLVTGTVNNASHANTASSIHSSLITGTTLPAAIVSSSLTGLGTLGSLTVSGNTNIDSGTFYVDATNNRVGIGVVNPNQTLTVVGTASITSTLNVGGTITGNLSGNASTASSINASLITGTTLPAAIVNSSLTSVGTLGSLTVSQATGRVVLQTDGGGNVNIGRADNASSTPFIDFNSGATSVDYDVRIQVSGGNGSPGNGLMSVTASQVNVDNGVLFIDGGNNRVGINTTNPNQSLTVVGTASITGNATFGANITLGTSSANTEVRSQPIFDTLTTNAATVQVATSANNYRLQRSTASSRKWKNSIEDMPPTLDQIMNLRPVTFKFNENYIPETDIRYNVTVPGLIAEEVFEAIPVAAEMDDNGPSDWNIRMLFPMLVKAVQEQQEEIIRLRDIIENL